MGMSRIVRSSKYRHVFGTAEKRENCFDGVKVSGGAWDSNKVAAGNSFVAAIWEAGGGGSFAVLGNDQTGKLGEIPLVTGHKGKVLDVAFSRFNDNLVASVSEDGDGRIWAIPEGGLKENLVDPVQTLIGHKRKVGSVNFHPTADNVVATSSTDYTVKVSLEGGFVAKAKPEFKPTAVKEVKEEKPKTEAEWREEVTALNKRVAYLEAEIAKKDARIKELEA